MITNMRCGNRIVTLGKGLSVVTLQAHPKGSPVLFSQRGFHVVYPLLDVSVERAPPPTELQMHDTGIRDRTTLGDPPLPHEYFHHLTACGQPLTPFRFRRGIFPFVYPLCWAGVCFLCGIS